MRSVRLRRTLWVPTVSLAIVWGLLYLPHLRTSPGWYSDETGALLAGTALFHGDTSYGALQLTYWSNFMPYQPGYLWLIGLSSSLTSGDILGARLLSTALALAIALSIYRLGRSSFGIPAAWFGAMVFLTYRQSIIHFRWAYPHDAVALGFTVMALYLLRPRRPDNDWRAGIGLGIATLAHPLFVHGAAAAVLSQPTSPRSWIRFAIPSLAVLVATFALITWVYWPEAWLLADISGLAKTYGRNTATGSSGATFARTFFEFYSQDLFQLGGLIGAGLCTTRRLRSLPICIASISVPLLMNRQNLTVFYYQAIVATPLLAMAWAGGVSVIAGLVRRRLGGRRWQRLIQATVFVLPLAFMARELPAVLQGRLSTLNQQWVTQDIPEVEAAASWLNERTSARDLVIAGPSIAWLLRAKTADLLEATAWQGIRTRFLGATFGRERFRYSADVQAAKFVVIGDVDQRWTLRQPGVKSMLRTRAPGWPIVWSGDFYKIFANPRYAE